MSKTLTSLGRIKKFLVLIDNFPHERLSPHTIWTHQDQNLPRKRWHPLNSLVQLEVSCVNLGVLTDMIWEPLLLFPLKSFDKLNKLKNRYD